MKSAIAPITRVSVIRHLHHRLCNLTVGLVYGAVLAHVPGHWIVVGGIVLVGVGVLTGVKATRQKDSAP
jgi:hypothetical protein